jgi:large-conductance mechanosensitive channel
MWQEPAILDFAVAVVLGSALRSLMAQTYPV